jgi:hypothetical protein
MMNAHPSPLSAKPRPAWRPAWQRWVSIWHAVFYASLAIAVIYVVLSFIKRGDSRVELKT